MIMKNIKFKIVSPKLKYETFNSDPGLDDLTRGGKRFICFSILNHHFKVPRKKKGYWLTASLDNHKGAVLFWVRFKWGCWRWGKHPSRRNKVLYANCRRYLDRHIPKKLLDPQGRIKLWVSMDYLE